MKKVLFLLFVSLLALSGCSSKKTSDYRADLLKVTDDMIENDTSVENLLNQYSAVWSFSIESDGAILVDDMAAKTGIDRNVIVDYFKINSAGNIPNDFSTNINSLNAYYEGTDQLDEIRNTSKDIKDSISKLNSPPKDYEKVYDEVLDMYNLSEEYIEMALNPSGSLQTFNENKGELSSEILSKYKRIEVIMPSKE